MRSKVAGAGHSKRGEFGRWAPGIKGAANGPVSVEGGPSGRSVNVAEVLLDKTMELGTGAGGDDRRRRLVALRYKYCTDRVTKEARG